MISHDADARVLVALPVHALSPMTSSERISCPEVDAQQDSSELTRSASFTDIPGDTDSLPSPGIKRIFSENVLALQPDRPPKNNSSVYSTNKELLRRASRSAKNKIKSTKSLAVSEDVENKDNSAPFKKSGPVDVDPTKGPSRSVTGTIRSLARKSWLPSRSPSPAKRDVERLTKARSQSPAKKSKTIFSEVIEVPARAASSQVMQSEHNEAQPEVTELPRQITTATKPKRRPLSVISMKNKSDTDLRHSRTPSTPSLRSKSSYERFSKRLSSVKVPPIPSSLSSDRLSSLSIDVIKKKDPLWGAFRELDGEYVMFQSKSSAHKAKVIRSGLLPFLTKYRDHPSNKSLRAEDVDRRIVILNKWWTGLLEMLNGRNSQSISGTDRPVFLEAVSSIMTRPEWRSPPFPSLTPLDTPARPALLKSRSTNSLGSMESDFLSESIYSNVRNTFVQNLLSQMAFVVDRMSMRSAPASLVTFCGKACAYAFFFCPGVADILVRLWHIPTGTVRRILAEFDVDRGFGFSLVSNNIASYFPLPLRSLSVSSQAALARHLQHKSPAAPGAAYIRWYGPWVGRWSGRDSDLFYVFTKHYHLLVADHLPGDIGLQSRACIPGFVPVHCQILTLLENTIYKQAGHNHAENAASSMVSDMDKADAAPPLPLMIANSTRSMAENRLVMLLRDLAADINPEHELFRALYLQSFNNVVKAVSRKISLYNNDACFVLCDFMEEVLQILVRHQSNYPAESAIDWPFWLRVCRQMMESHNTLTEVRLISFVYSMWNIITSDYETKRKLCLGWLLEPAFFQEHFNNWCPMVRHYFHRLLCWRLARYDGDATDLDIEIYEALAARLNTSWAYHSYITAEAEMRDIAVPSTAPCTPAPNRRLIVIRTDSQPASASAFASFDKLTAPAVANQTTPYRTHSSLLNSLPNADSPTPTKKRWSLFKSIMPFNNTPGNKRPGEVTPPGSSDEASPATDSVSVNVVSAKNGIGVKPSASAPKSRPATPPHQAFSFKFSLVWLDHPAWPSQNRVLTAPTLPASAQIVVQMRQEKVVEVKPQKPPPEDLKTAKYAGRALAEWSMVVAECEGFYQRRKVEGVPSSRLVETPMLGVESFRMFG